MKTETMSNWYYKCSCEHCGCDQCVSPEKGEEILAATDWYWHECEQCMLEFRVYGDTAKDIKTQRDIY